jgi:hypothetical protein
VEDEDRSEAHSAGTPTLARYPLPADSARGPEARHAAWGDAGNTAARVATPLPARRRLHPALDARGQAAPRAELSTNAEALRVNRAAVGITRIEDPPG